MKDVTKSVCSFDKCKELKDLGVKQTSLLYYLKRRGSDKIYLKTKTDADKLKNSAELSYICSAFTASEIGEILVYDGYKEYLPKIQYNYERKSFIAYAFESGGVNLPHIFKKEGKYETDTRSELLIFLIKKKNGIT